MCTPNNIADDVQLICTPLFQLLFHCMVYDGNKIHLEKCLDCKSVQHGLLPTGALTNDPPKSSKCYKTTVGITKARITMMMFKSLKGMASEYSTQMFSIYENKTKTTT